MPKIETYNFDENISDNDFLLGTDGDEDNKTKSYRIRTLINKIKSEVNLTAFIQVETLPTEDIQLNTIYVLPNGDWNYYNGTIWLSNSNRPYKVYTALLTQYGTDAPIATVLENTLGDVVFTRTEVGEYLATLNGSFILNKTIISFGNIFNYNVTSINIVSVPNETFTINSFQFFTYDDGFMIADLILNNTPIEIRVYN